MIFLRCISIHHFKGFPVLQVSLAEKLINTARAGTREAITVWKHTPSIKIQEYLSWNQWYPHLLQCTRVYLLIKDSSLQNYAKWSTLRKWRGKKESSCAKLKPRDIMLENILLLLICACYWKSRILQSKPAILLTSPCSSATSTNIFCSCFSFLNSYLPAKYLFLEENCCVPSTDGVIFVEADLCEQDASRYI